VPKIEFKEIDKQDWSKPSLKKANTDEGGGKAPGYFESMGTSTPGTGFGPNS